MSLRDSRVVDRMALEKGTGHVVLTLLDDEDWNDQREHLELLQEKLNTYLAFIESGEVYERVSSHVGRSVSASTPVKVNVIARYAVPAEGRAFLSYAEQEFAGAGVALSHRLFELPS